MPQEIRVLRCYNCDLFQTDIVKKATKWQCKVCQFKQTVRKEYLRGCGVTCRQKAQELNKENGQKQSVQSIIKREHKMDLPKSEEVDVKEYVWPAIESLELGVKKQEELVNNSRNVKIEKEDRNVDGAACTEVFKDMFDFSQTQKWRRHTEKDPKISKISKWDCYT